MTAENQWMMKLFNSLSLPPPQIISVCNYHFFFKHPDNFLQEMVLSDETAVQNDFKEFLSIKTAKFNVTRINRLIYCWQRCIDSNCYFFINRFYSNRWLKTTIIFALMCVCTFTNLNFVWQKILCIWHPMRIKLTIKLSWSVRHFYIHCFPARFPKILTYFI